jgi:hypothetical protein
VVTAGQRQLHVQVRPLPHGRGLPWWERYPLLSASVVATGRTVAGVSLPNATTALSGYHFFSVAPTLGSGAEGEVSGFCDPVRSKNSEQRYALHDRDTKFCPVFRATLAAGGIKPIPLPARSPNLNAYAERWVRSAKEECLSKLILFGEASLRRALTAFINHYHQERNHQGKNNVVLFPALLPLSPVGDLASTVESASAAYFGITVAPHEFLGHMGKQPV